jgi:hypothetical protein
MSRIHRVLTATAMATVLTTTLAAWTSGGTEAAAETGTLGQGGSCTYKAQGAPTFKSHKGKGDKKYNYGETKRDGRLLILSTGTATSADNSAARLSGKVRKGDRVWVDISHDKGKNWKGCGGVTTDKADKQFYSKWYAHYRKGEITNRVIRACARTTTNDKRTTWCATVGDVKTSGRYWWTDKD